MKDPSPPPCPAYLAGTLAQRWAQLAPELVKLGTLDALNVDVAGKYILAENEYLKVSAMVQLSISGDKEHGVTPDPEAAVKWIAAQDRLTKQILTLGSELGITPSARRAKGLPRR